ncbi:MAG: glycosyltransferase [Chitinophagaceae bacterium]
MENKDVNSKEYWDGRFESDWKDRGGKEQSAFFSRVAVDNLPVWLKSEIKEKKYSVCDWGCAFGDGTSILKEYLDINSITGVDFSPIAIEYAQKTFPGIDFLAADFTKELPDTRFDILFTSNTLEHFESPWETLNAISGLACCHIVVLIPFKEYERFEEHFYTFDFHNIPFALPNGFVLAHSAIINTSLLEARYWNGKQGLFVFSSPDTLATTHRSLQDVSVDSTMSSISLNDQLRKELSMSLQELNYLKGRNEALEAQIREKKNEVEHREELIKQKDIVITSLNEVRTYHDELQQQKKDISVFLRTEFDKAVSVKENIIALLQKEVSENEITIANLRARIEMLDQQVLEKNDLFEHEKSKKESVNDQLQKDHLLALRDLENSRNNNAVLSEELKRADKALNDLQTKSDSLSEENKWLNSVLKELRNDLYSAKMQNQVVNEAFEEIRDSRSWRYTSFLRLPVYHGKKLARSFSIGNFKTAFTRNKLFNKKPQSRPSFPSSDVRTIDLSQREDLGKAVWFFVKEFNSGGLERVVFDLAMLLKEKGYVVSIAVANQGGKIEAEALRTGLDVFVLNEDKDRLRHFISERPPDVVLINHCYFELNAFKEAGVPIVEIMHNAYFWQRNNDSYKKMRTGYINTYVAVSQFVHSYAIKYLGISAESISVINNGLNSDGFIRPSQKLIEVIRDRSKENDFKFILAANFRPSKSHCTAIAALKKVLEKHPNVRLQFAGGVDDENLYQFLRNRVVKEKLEQHVEFLGLLNRRQLSHVMTKAQAAILPSSYEGLSITSLEYMFFGLPMILTDLGGANEVIREGDIGIVIPAPIEINKLDNEIIAETGLHPNTKDINNLADAMLNILDHYEEWKQKGKKGIAKIEDYSIGKVVNQYVGIIENVISKN